MSFVACVKVSLIRCISSSVLLTGNVYTRVFTKPHRKKSRGVISGECSGHGVSAAMPKKENFNRFIFGALEKTLLEGCPVYERAVVATNYI